MATEDFNTNKLSIVISPNEALMLPKNIESIGGAKCALKSLKIIEQIASSGNHTWTIDDCIEAEESATLAVLLAAGEVSDKAKGVLMTLTEYIYTLHECGTPNLEIWKPTASLSENEMIEYKEFYTEHYEV